MSLKMNRKNKFENKLILFGILFFATILFLSTAVLAYSRTSYDYLGSQGIALGGSTGRFNGASCSPGQDFVVQVAPLGCSPTVVRSDLLEEQNVPVFCQLAATQINPLMNVEAIEGITFSGNYPEGVSGVGFHPAQAALKNSRNQLLNSPTLNNIGYAVVVLEQNPVEDEMPDFVEGTLTAKLRYDIQNAFGIGRATYILPEMNDEEWEENNEEYSFWQGRGFLRAESIDENSATILVYSDENNVASSSTLNVGETSGLISIPTLACGVDLNVRLDRVENPRTRAKLEINGDLIEVNVGERFLENKCVLRNVNLNGISQSAQIQCNTDDGAKAYLLRIDPEIVLNIDGVEGNYKVGDYLFTDSSNRKNVYLGYAGNPKKNFNIQDTYVVLTYEPERKSRLTEAELNTIAFQVENALSDSSLLVDVGKDFTFLSSSLTKLIAEGSGFVGAFNYGEDFDAYGKKVSIVNFGESQDLSLSEEPSKLENEFLNSFENAKGDYQTLFNDFKKVSDDSLQGETYGERAILNFIDLAYKTNQKKTLNEACDDLKESFSQSLSKTKGVCDNNYLISNSEISTRTFSINGFAKTVSFLGIREPSFEELGATIFIEGPGKRESVDLRLNQRYNLEEFRGQSGVYVLEGIEGSGGYLSWFDDNIRFVYDGTKWTFSLDGIIWTDIVITENKITGLNVKDAGRLPDEILNLFSDLDVSDFEDGLKLLEGHGAKKQIGNEFVQVLEINDDYVKVRVKTENERTSDSIRNIYSEGIKILRKEESQSVGGGFIMTLMKTNVEKVARTSIIPEIRNHESEANFTFKIGIEKRAIQLSPDEIEDKLQSVEEQVAVWGNISETLGTTVKGFKAACLSTGAFLTVKNLINDVDGSALARQEVMRGPGGWNEICERESQETGISMDACFSENDLEIDRDVDSLTRIIQNQNEAGAINKDNIGSRLGSIKEDLNGENIDGKTLNIEKGSPLDLALSEKGYTEGIVSERTARDVERWTAVINDPNTSPELKKIAQTNLNSKLTDLEKTSQNFADRLTTASVLGLQEYQVSGIDTEKDLKNLPYTGTDFSKMSRISNYDKIVTSPDAFGFAKGQSVSSLKTQTVIDKYDGTRYLVFLDNDYIVVNTLKINEETNGARVLTATESAEAVKSRFGQNVNLDNPLKLTFQKYDSESYKNPFRSVPKVRYFETDPYKGMPAHVPFDTKNGWYVETSQLSSTTIGLPKSSGAFDDSGRPASFKICNVGKDGRPDLSESSGDDDCRGFDLTGGKIYGNFPGLTDSETERLVRRASDALTDAANAYKPGLSGKIAIGSEFIDVGEPAASVPQIQCQDFMSPSDCNLLFNVCDPVICPSSRCDLGGNYQVDNVIQSGIVGSIAMCLPNAGEVAVPICLSGVKSGVDGLLSVYENYESCLEEQLETGQTVGICDEVYSIYMCDFFWRQSVPVLEAGVPAIINKLTGKSNSGGGEYLGFQSAWDNAEGSVDYMTNYYGVNSLNSFRARTTDEVGGEFCKAFISARYPASAEFFDALIEPDSPPQYHAWFEEIPFTTATVPPTSQYKVFYHIYSGDDSGAYYSVYLKSPAGTSFFQSVPRINVASGYIDRGDFASETLDFTESAGYKELCVNVNGKEDCGFSEVSTSFLINYASDKFIEEQANRTDIKSESECVSGSINVYGLVNPNIQSGVQDALSPQITNQGIVRVCSTENPGLGTDPSANLENSRWKEVGYCDANQRLKCYLDTQSVKKAVDFKNIENGILENVAQHSIDIALSEGKILSEGEFNKVIDEISKKLTPEERITLVNEVLEKAFFDFQRARLILIRGDSRAEIVVGNYYRLVGDKTSTEYEKVPRNDEGIPDCSKITDAKICNDLTTDFCWYDEYLGECIHTEYFVGEESVVSLTTEGVDEGMEESLNFCGECGKGINICDEEECNDLGKKSGIECVFIDGSLRNKCVAREYSYLEEGAPVYESSGFLSSVTNSFNEDVALATIDNRLASTQQRLSVESLHAQDVFELSREMNVDFNLVRALIRQESDWDPTSTPDIGLLQLTPSPNLASDFVEGGNCRRSFVGNGNCDIDVPQDSSGLRSLSNEENLQVGICYVACLRDYYGIEDSRTLVGAYNAGPSISNSCKADFDSCNSNDFRNSLTLNTHVPNIEKYYVQYNEGSGIVFEPESDQDSFEIIPEVEGLRYLVERFEFKIDGQVYNGNELDIDRILNVKVLHSCNNVESEIRSSITFWPDSGSNVLIVGNEFKIDASDYDVNDKFYLRTYCLDENYKRNGHSIDSKIFKVVDYAEAN